MNIIVFEIIFFEKQLRLGTTFQYGYLSMVNVVMMYFGYFKVIEHYNNIEKRLKICH
jgi:hypothetical protein